jgi:FAD/FMN-containing dehydrogenase
MAAVHAADKKHLESLFGTRVSFDRRERKLYGHDIAEVPSLIKPLIGSTVPEAIVQPASEEEIAALVRWAQKNRIALTPRGRASSGYGGVLPVKGGFVVDFFHLSKLLEIDTKTFTARVQPGICWEKLDRELARAEE